MKDNTIKFVDCIKGLKKITSKFCKHFYTYPPIDIDFTKIESMYNRSKKGIVKGYTEPSYNNKKLTYREWCDLWIPELYRITEDNGSGWICSGWSNLADVIKSSEQAGFIIINHIIWKYQFGVYTKKKFVSSHYHLLFMVKNSKNYYFNLECRYSKDEKDTTGKKLNYADREDVWTIKRPYRRGEEKNANTQPIELVKKALQYTVEPGSILVDPFMGGATTAVVCKKLGIPYIGFEINKNLKKYVNERLRDA